LNPECASFVGEAFTLRYIPAREDIDTIDIFADPLHPQRLAIESVKPGQVLIMDCRQDAHAASSGSILMTRLKMRGAVAMVTDASLRDTPALASLEFPMFSAGASATINLARHHAVDFQVPIACAGVAVYPGDILVGDAEGVVVIPRHLAVEVAAAAAEQEELERFLLKRVSEGAALVGTYPPNEQTLSDFRAERDS
jgi:regulator of RNase E activity RraA